jgi:hypothetical protein
MSTLTRASAPPEARRLRLPASRFALPAGLFLAGLAISGFTALRHLDPYDEGQLLLGVRHVIDGQWLYADYVFPYGPGHPLVLAVMQDLFGQSLLWWRLIRVAADATVALLVFVIVRREAPLPVALLAWLIAATGMAEPGGPNPFPVALALGLAAFAVATKEPPLAARDVALKRTFNLTNGERAEVSGGAEGRGVAGVAGGWRRPAAAGLLVALAAFWRIDFGVYAGAAILVALLLAPREGATKRMNAPVAFASTAVGATILLYLPFAIAAGPRALWHQMVGQGLHDSKYWTLPFPWSYPGPFRVSSVGHVAHDVKKLIDFYVPAALLVGLALLAGMIVARSRRGRDGLPWRWIGLLVYGLGTLVYLHSRADEFHTQPLLVVTATGLVLGASWLWRERRGLPTAAAAPLLAGAGVVLALLAIHGSWNRASALLRPPTLVRVGLPGTSAVTDTPANVAALRQVVPYVQARVPPGQPIFVAPRRSDLDRLDDLLFYVLVGRDSVLNRGATLEALPAQQRTTVAALERERPRIVVRWIDPISSQPEPNLRGRASGSRVLDDYLARAYRRTAQFGVYVVLERR